MNKVSQKITAISIITAALLIPSTQGSVIFADEKSNDSSSVNGVVIRAIFKFGAQQETIDTFRVFKQLGGFDRSTMPTFELEGVVDGDRPLLYQVVDQTYHYGQFAADKHYFDVDIYLHNDKLYRHFVYSQCIVQDYSVTTNFDDEEAWNGDKKFAIVDEFKFQCSGYDLKNPLLEQKIKDHEKEAAEKTDQMMREKFPEIYK